MACLYQKRWPPDLIFAGATFIDNYIAAMNYTVSRFNTLAEVRKLDGGIGGIYFKGIEINGV